MKKNNPGGVLVGTGSFRVDSKRALKKIRDFQVGSSLAPELLWIRAANAGGAQEIRMRRTFREFTISFDGRPASLKFLKDPFFCVIDETVADGRHEVHVARALLRELRDKPEFITVRSNGRRLRVSGILPKHRSVSKTAEVSERLVVRIRWSLWRSMRISRIGSEELAPLTVLSRATVILDNSPLPQDREENLREFRFRKEGFRGKIRPLSGYARASTRTRSILHPAKDGVSLETRKIRSVPAAVEAWVDSGHWKLNASLDKVVAEENFQRGVAVIDKATQSLIRSELKAHGHRATRIGQMLMSADEVRANLFRNGHLITPEEAFGVSRVFGTLVVDIRRTLWLRDVAIRVERGPKVLRALLDRADLFWNVRGVPLSIRVIKKSNSKIVRYDDIAWREPQKVSHDIVWCFLGREDRRWLSRLVSSTMRRVGR